MVVIKFDWRNFPNNFIGRSEVIDFDGEISSIIVSSELGGWDISFLEGSANWFGCGEISLLFKGSDGISAGSSSRTFKSIYNSSSL